MRGVVAWGLAVVGTVALAACGRAPLASAGMKAPGLVAKAAAYGSPQGPLSPPAAPGTALSGQVAEPVTACAALAWGHEAARKLEPTPAFIRLEGSHIGLRGVPRAKGTWALRYLGAPAGGGQGIRFVEVLVAADGKATAGVRLEPSFLLGAPCFDAPMPKLDSPMALNRARSLGPASVGPNGAPKLVLTGAYRPGHDPRLAWMVGPATQAAGAAPLRLDADTGEQL